jgi:hypothetical protein
LDLQQLIAAATEDVEGEKFESDQQAGSRGKKRCFVKPCPQ